jgi:hypothetical protein
MLNIKNSARATMNECPDVPLDRARAKCQQLERELSKIPDFQRYLLSQSPVEQERVEGTLNRFPAFRLWRNLMTAIKNVAAQKDSDGERRQSR